MGLPPQQQPASMSKLRFDAPEWVPPGRAISSKPSPPPAAPPEPLLLELPAEVTACILAHVGPSPQDLAAAGLACKPLQASLASAAVQLDLSTAAAPPSIIASTSSSHLKGLHDVVASIAKYMPGAVSLNLSGLPAEDVDVLQLLRQLPRLQQLQLASCRKLTGRLTAALAQLWAQQHPEHQDQHQDFQQQQGQQQQQQEQQAQEEEQAAGAGAVACTSSGAAPPQQPGGPQPPAPHATRRSSLACLDLQRCFQLRGSALGELLGAAARGHVPLHTLALSHLDLAAWPPQPATTPTVHEQEVGAGTGPLADSTRSSSGGGPISDAALALALGLRTGHSASPAAAAGSASTPGHATPPTCGVLAAAAMPTRLPTTQITLLALNNCSGLTHTALWSLARLCPRLEYLMLGGCTFLPARSSTGGAAGGAPPADAAHMLASTLAQLRCLRAVELTFFPPSLVAAVEAQLQQAATKDRSLSCRSAGPANETCSDCAAAQGHPRVWVFTRNECVAQAVALLQQGHGAGSRSSHTGSSSSLAMVMRCGANCSNAARMGPLHVAAELGEAGRAAGLLQLGAVVDARDMRGNTPLFRASYHGHLHCARALLDAGAYPQLPNAAGERPLYIAALRGHEPLVRALLHACRQRGLPWQDAHLYGDAWTPLMAGAVANRYDVCSLLLHAAGPSGGHEQAALVGAVNRYGQCVLHIAARKASQELLRLLLAAAGPAPWGVCAVQDSNGDTPLDVARKNRNATALEELTRQLQPPPRQQPIPVR